MFVEPYFRLWAYGRGVAVGSRKPGGIISRAAGPVARALGGAKGAVLLTEIVFAVRG